jgi:hypothetical protein
MPIVQGLGQAVDSEDLIAAALERGDFLAASDAERALKTLGFFLQPLDDLTSIPEWDFDTTRAFDAWARARGITYELQPDPAPQFEDRPRAYMLVVPIGVADRLLSDEHDVTREPVEVTITRVDPETGATVFVQEQKVEGSAGPLALAIVGAAAVAGIAWLFAETRTVVSGLGGWRRRQAKTRSKRFRRRHHAYA